MAKWKVTYKVTESMIVEAENDHDAINKVLDAEPRIHLFDIRDVMEEKE